MYQIPQIRLPERFIALNNQVGVLPPTDSISANSATVQIGQGMVAPVRGVTLVKLKVVFGCKTKDGVLINEGDWIHCEMDFTKNLAKNKYKIKLDLDKAGEKEVEVLFFPVDSIKVLEPNLQHEQSKLRPLETPQVFFMNSSTGTIQESPPSNKRI